MDKFPDKRRGESEGAANRVAGQQDNRTAVRQGERATCPVNIHGCTISRIQVVALLQTLHGNHQTSFGFLESSAPLAVTTRFLRYPDEAALSTSSSARPSPWDPLRTFPRQSRRLPPQPPTPPSAPTHALAPAPSAQSLPGSSLPAPPSPCRRPAAPRPP